jgi:hypothetical protein
MRLVVHLHFRFPHSGRRQCSFHARNKARLLLLESIRSHMRGRIPLERGCGNILSVEQVFINGIVLLEQHGCVCGGVFPKNEEDRLQSKNICAPGTNNLIGTPSVVVINYEGADRKQNCERWQHFADDILWKEWCEESMLQYAIGICKRVLPDGTFLMTTVPTATVHRYHPRRVTTTDRKQLPI